MCDSPAPSNGGLLCDGSKVSSNESWDEDHSKIFEVSLNNLIGDQAIID